MDDKSKIGVVLIGGGTIAPLHAKYLLSSPTCELLAIIDPFSPGQNLAKSLSVPHFPTVPELLSSTSRVPEAYIICAPSGLHVSLATGILGLTSPKVILVEKPISTTSNSGTQLISLAKTKECKLMVGHHRRYYPALDASKQLILSGKLGKITAVTGQWMSKKTGDYFEFAEWRRSRSRGGGPVWTNFVHDIDVLHFLTGSKVIRVWATGTVSRRGHDGVKEGDEVEEGAAILFQFADGVVGTFVLCDNVASPYGWDSATGDNPSYPKAEGGVDAFRVFGSDGTLSVPDGCIWTYTKEGTEKRGVRVGWNAPMTKEILKVVDGVPFQLQVEHLARVVTGIEEPRCSGEDGLAAVKVCEAVIKALRNGDGCPVDISHIV
ncbi:hypothetical protein B7463_g10257, partial [Scytalidium lignicola]